MFSVNYIFLMNITYIFAIITCLGFLVRDFSPMSDREPTRWQHNRIYPQPSLCELMIVIVIIMVFFQMTLRR